MFIFKEALTQKEMDDVFRFRYDILCEEMKIFKKEDYPDKLEKDRYDPYSIQFAAYNKNNEVVACVRLVHHCPFGYPAVNALNIDDEFKDKFLQNDEMGELSRIFIHKDYRNIKTTKEIITLLKIHVCKRMKELGISVSFGAVECSFLRLLNIFKLPYTPIGLYQMYGGRMRAPCIMYTDDIYKNNKELFTYANN